MEQNEWNILRTNSLFDDVQFQTAIKLMAGILGGKAEVNQHVIKYSASLALSGAKELMRQFLDEDKKNDNFNKT